MLAAGSAAARPADDLTVAVSSHAAGAKGVRLTLSYESMLQCGRPRAGASIHLPVAAAVPATIAAASVTMNGRPVGSAVLRRHVLSVTAPKTTGMLCNSITTGTVTLVIAPSARVANPAQAGTYRVTVVSGGSTHSGTYAVS
jgi:hypothetical protein